MNNILAVFTQNILPILIVAGCGFALQKWQALDKQTLSKVTLYVLSPALVFSSLVNSDLETGDIGSMVLFTVLAMAAMAILAFLPARMMHFSRRETAALVITVVFVNGGNYGLTLNQLRYGDAGLSLAIVYYATSTVLVYSAGIFIASMGRLPWRAAVKRLLSLPPIYAATGAILVYFFAIPVPEPLMSAIEILGRGAIPVMLLVLGMQMADMKGNGGWRLTVPAIGLRLLVGPVVAVFVASLVGLQGLSRSVSIIEASMPTAVITIILATE
ncbi:MAG: AEC family transporter, partial [Anaerolineae bacterium]|nr:AEC family transporter [Anaerolineae bacterium]